MHYTRLLFFSDSLRLKKCFNFRKNLNVTSQPCTCVCALVKMKASQIAAQGKLSSFVTGHILLIKYSLGTSQGNWCILNKIQANKTVFNLSLTLGKCQSETQFKIRYKYPPRNVAVLQSTGSRRQQEGVCHVVFIASNHATASNVHTQPRR